MTRAALLLVGLVSTALLAGCLGDEATPTTDEPEAPEPTEAVNATALPEPTTTRFDITPAVDAPLPVGEEEFCWMPSESCIIVPVTVPAGALTLSATLTWGVDQHNLGLFLYDATGAIVDQDSGPRTSGTSAEVVASVVASGDYTVVIDPHWATVDTAELTLAFGG